MLKDVDRNSYSIFSSKYIGEKYTNYINDEYLNEFNDYISITISISWYVYYYNNLFSFLLGFIILQNKRGSEKK